MFLEVCHRSPREGGGWLLRQGGNLPGLESLTGAHMAQTMRIRPLRAFKCWALMSGSGKG